MKRYKGSAADDEKPIGGGSYTRKNVGAEVFNFLPVEGKLRGFFQPSGGKVRLERIEPGFRGDALDGVLLIFVARNPNGGGQYIVGWYRDATLFRQPRSSPWGENFPYVAEAAEDRGKLLPESRRLHRIPTGRGALGQANVWYPCDENGQEKADLGWVDEALRYVDGVADALESETQSEVTLTAEMGIERDAGFQSNPQIRTAIETYAMKWALKRLTDLGLQPKDMHSTQCYDFLCTQGGEHLFVEVKGTQANGRSVSLSLNEVKHALEHKNSALFIVHSVMVNGKRKPRVSGGQEVFCNPWGLSEQDVKPSGYFYTLPP
jgi:hypothetical protein